jgi:hypothetical protein
MKEFRNKVNNRTKKQPKIDLKEVNENEDQEVSNLIQFEGDEETGEINQPGK